MEILVLGLGNDFIADDGLGIYAARDLLKQISDCVYTNDHVDVVETSAAGIALLEDFIGYDKAIIIDAVKTGKHPPGYIQEWRAEDLSKVVAPSPHYAGLPELLALAKRMELDYPEEFAIFSMEAEDPYTIGKGLSESVIDALPKLIGLVYDRINQWLEMENEIKVSKASF